MRRGRRGEAEHPAGARLGEGSAFRAPAPLESTWGREIHRREEVRTRVPTIQQGRRSGARSLKRDLRRCFGAKQIQRAIESSRVHACAVFGEATLEQGAGLGPGQSSRHGLRLLYRGLPRLRCAEVAAESGAQVARKLLAGWLLRPDRRGHRKTVAVVFDQAAKLPHGAPVVRLWFTAVARLVSA